MRLATACLAFSLMVFLPGRSGPAAAESHTEEVFQRYENRVVQVRVLEKSSGERSVVGSGFFIEPSGLAVTNFHVVADLIWQPGDYRAEAVLVSGLAKPLTIVSLDVVHDLALIKVEGGDYPAFALEPAATPKGARLYAMGNPHDLGLTIVEGSFSGLLEESLLQKLHFTGSVNPGMSGGPVLNRAGRVVGVSVATAGNQVSFLVPSTFVRPLAPAARPAADTAALRALLREQLLAHQESVYETILAKPFAVGDLGPFRAPGRLSPAFHCWAKTESDPTAPYQSVHSQCETEDAIFVTEDIDLAGISMTHHALTSDSLGAFQFAALQKDHFERSEGYDKSHLASNLNRPQELTDPECSSGFVSLGGIPAKASYCVQAYARFPGLYDVRWRAASLAETRRGFTSAVSLEGVSLENAEKFLKAYMEAFAWKK